MIRIVALALVVLRMVAMTIVVKRTAVQKHVAQNIVALVALRTAARLRNLAAALDHARHLAVDQVALAVSAPRCMLGHPKVEAQVVPKVSVLRRAVMMNGAARKVTVSLKHVARNIVALVVRLPAVLKVVVLKVVVLKVVVLKVVVLKLDHRPVAQKAEAKAVVQNHVAPKLAVKIAVLKVALNALPLAHNRVAPKVAGLKHAAMMNAVRKVAGLVVLRHVAKAPAVVKVDVVRRRLVMTM